MELRDDFAGADPSGIIDDPNARALANQLAGVVGGKLRRYPANQEPESIHLVRARRLDRTGHEFVTPRRPTWA
jgi:hypothetical protein